MNLQVRQDRDELSAALVDADPVILLMALTQLTGDLTFLERVQPFIRKARDQQPGDIPDALQQEIRGRLAGVLAGGAPAASAPNDDVYARMIAACVGEPVPPEYLRMLLNNSALVPAQTAPIAQVPKDFRVVIVGGGLSGVAMAIYLQKAGVDFLIVERSAEPGGVWVDNVYPGCGVDTASHFYSYSFAQNPDWSRYFALKAEIKRYIADCVDRFGLRSRLRLSTAVKTAAYIDSDKRWKVTLAGPNGEETVECGAVVSAVGQLNEPFYPQIKGLESFKGPVFHTARWSQDVDYAGKRVALIGTGASSLQVGPTIAPHVRNLIVFQRSPQWLRNKPGYHDQVSAAHRWVFRNIPFYGNWFRLRLVWQYGDLAWPASRIDPNRGEGIRVSRANDDLRAQWTSYIRDQLKERPDLLPKVLPDYPPMTKRTPVDNGWFDMLKRDNVALVIDGIDHVGDGFIVTKDGARHDVDIIVLATGFQASRMLKSIEVKGREGRDLRDLWGVDDPRAYLGITVPGFPNFFVMYGPNTNLGGGGNIIFHGECQANYIAAALRHMFESGHGTIEVKQDAYDRWNAKLDERMSGSVFTTPGVNSSFKNAKGEVRSVSPWRIQEYWTMTRDLDEQDYVSS